MKWTWIQTWTQAWTRERDTDKYIDLNINIVTSPIMVQTYLSKLSLDWYKNKGLYSDKVFSDIRLKHRMSDVGTADRQYFLMLLLAHNLHPPPP